MPVLWKDISPHLELCGPLYVTPLLFFILNFVWYLLFCQLIPCGPGGGGRGTLCNDLYREALPERGTFFRLQVHERVEILLVEVYNRVGESVIWVFLRVQKGWQMNLMGFKSRGTFYFCDWSMIYSSWKECKVLNKVCERGTICQ